MNKPNDMNTTVPLWIDGKAQAATSTRCADVTNPATGKVTRRVPLANHQDIETAVASAKRAFPAWRDTPP
ncbi:MAG: hypothetical protein RJA24_806, partial [Pseudomonadota bacterium]